MAPSQEGSLSAANFMNGLHTAAAMVELQLRYQDSMSRSTRIALTSGYASTNSAAKTTGRQVRAHGAVGAEELVPVCPGELGALVGKSGVESLVPHVAVADVGEEQKGMVA